MADRGIYAPCPQRNFKLARKLPDKASTLTGKTMRYLVCPEPIVVSKSNAPPQTISIAQYAEICWYEDRRWQKPIANMVRLNVVVAAFLAPSGALITLEDQDWNILKSIIEQPEMNQMGAPTLLPSPWYHRQLRPFEEAVLNATTERPAYLAE
jgi:hypothetical protein